MIQFFIYLIGCVPKGALKGFWRGVSTCTRKLKTKRPNVPSAFCFGQRSVKILIKAFKIKNLGRPNVPMITVRPTSTSSLLCGCSHQRTLVTFLFFFFCFWMPSKGGLGACHPPISTWPGNSYLADFSNG